MFFSVGLVQDSRFSNNYQAGVFWFNCDNGWQTIHVPGGCVYSKGYVDNFCAVTIDADSVKITHSVTRTFPLWYGPGFITNLPQQDLQQAWADDILTMHTSGAVCCKKKDLDLSVPNDTLSLDKATMAVKLLLDAKLQHLEKIQPHNLKLFCSGGVDTVLLYAMLESSNIQYDLLLEEHYEHDQFTISNKLALDQLWAYQQIHHWQHSTWLATGSCGDEYFLRGPLTVALLTAWHDINFFELLKQNNNCYHYHHFSKYDDIWYVTWESRHQLKERYPCKKALVSHVLDLLANDHQHWHLGNTLTWTPFNDLNISKILLQCDIHDLISQFLDGKITKSIIALYDDQAVAYISNFKNVNSLENFKENLKKHQVSKH